jgi:hypothetical protein
MDRPILRLASVEVRSKPRGHLASRASEVPICFDELALFERRNMLWVL